MTPDPQRQWYAYHKEQEIGPLAEQEIVVKLKTGEFGNATYVFTEGMNDWALVDTVDLFKPTPQDSSSQNEPSLMQAPHSERVGAEIFSRQLPKGASEITSGPIVKLKIGDVPAISEETSGPLPSGDSAQKEVLSPSPQGESVQDNSSETSHKVKTISRGPLIAFIFAGTILLGLGGVLAWRKVHKTKTIPAEHLSLAPTPVTVRVVSPEKEEQQHIQWSELEAQKLAVDSQSPPFRLSSTHLEGARPILVGALSSLLQPTSLKVAVYPDTQKNLMPLPSLWYFEVPVLDGFFSIGPLTYHSKPLPTGTYKLMLASKTSDTTSTFLGEVQFDVGVWPEGAALSEAQKNQETERQIEIDQQKVYLDTQVKALSSLFIELNTLGKIAAVGPVRNKIWIQSAESWQKKWASLLHSEQNLLKEIPLFKEEHTLLHSFLLELKELKDSLDILSAGGAKALQSKKHLRPGQMWIEIQKRYQNVLGSLRTVTTDSAHLPVLDPSEIKKHLSAGAK